MTHSFDVPEAEKQLASYLKYLLQMTQQQNGNI